MQTYFIYNGKGKIIISFSCFTKLGKKCWFLNHCDWDGKCGGKEIHFKIYRLID